MDLGVLHVVVLEVLAQHRRRGSRLECEDTSLWGELREEDGVVADIRAHVEDPPIRPNMVDEPTLRLQLAQRIVSAQFFIERDEFDRLSSGNGGFDLVNHCSKEANEKLIAEQQDEHSPERAR